MLQMKGVMLSMPYLDISLGLTWQAKRQITRNIPSQRLGWITASMPHLWSNTSQAWCSLNQISFHDWAALTTRNFLQTETWSMYHHAAMFWRPWRQLADFGMAFCIPLPMLDLFKAACTFEHTLVPECVHCFEVGGDCEPRFCSCFPQCNHRVLCSAICKLKHVWTGR